MLGTPPAFILSQDQTLMFKCLIYSSFCLANPRFTLLGIRFWSKHVLIIENLFLRCDSHLLLEFSGLFYCSIIKLLSSVPACFWLTLFCVSEIYIITLFRSCQHFFLSFFIFLQTLVFRPFCRKDSQSGNQNSVVLSTTFERKKTQYDVTHCVTEKEGFEPSRRANDLHP